MAKFVQCLLLLYVGVAFSQQDSTKVVYDKSKRQPIIIEQENLTPYLNDDNFIYEFETKEYGWWEALKNWFNNVLRSFFEWLFGVDAAPKYLSAFLKFLPYLLLGVLLFLVIRFFIKYNSKSILFSKNNPNLVSLSEEERIIESANIEMLIKEALEQKNYRLAVRYYYLLILKLLKDRELIDWKLQKTNDDYLEELSNSVLRPQFEKVTNLYDYIWYGAFNIDVERFDAVRTKFDQLKNSIATNV